MSTQILTELPSIQYSGMDFNSVMAELQEIVRNNPKWSDNWSEFYSSEAGQMFLQLMSWICDNLATRQDVLLNESFLSTANKKKNKIRLLKQIGYQPKLSHAAQAPIVIELNSVQSSDVVVTPDFTSTTSLALRANRIAKISGSDLNGDPITWEIIPLSNNSPDYLGGVKLKAGNTSYSTDSNGNEIFALQGETKYQELTAATSDGPYIDLTDSDISADSIAVYIKSNAKKCQLVTSFVSTEAMSSDYAIPYLITLNDNGTLRIRFAPADTLKADRLLPAGTTVSIFYRTSAGSSGNVPYDFINTRANFTTDSGENVSAIVKNEIAAYNGTDAEELDSAVLNAPLTLRTLDRAVTVEDFDILLKNNPNILKTKTYTASNNPNDFNTLYGRYINPQEAFIFALINHDYSNLPSTKYNEFPWISLYKVPRLNERYSFDSGENNVLVQKSETYYNFTLFESGQNVRKFNNATILNVGDTFNNAVNSNLDNAAFQLKLSTETVENDFFSDIPYSLMTHDDRLGKMMVTDLNDHVEITLDDNAKFISKESYTKEVEDGTIDCVDIINCRYILLSLDGRTEMVIDLYENFGDGLPNEHYYVFWDNIPDGSVAPATDARMRAAYDRHGIIQLINSQIVAIANGSTSQDEAANVYTADNAYQWMGLNVADPDNSVFAFDDPDYQRRDMIVTINGVTFKFPFTPIDDTGMASYRSIVDELNGHFQNSESVRIYEDGFWVPNTYDLSGLVADIVQTTNYLEGEYSYSYDMFIKTKDSTWLSDSKIDVAYNATSADSSGSDEYKGIEYNGEYDSLIHALHNRDIVVDYKTLLGANLIAVSYENLAKMLPDPNDPAKEYFQISSPMSGKFSSIQFLTNEIIEEGHGNFMRDFLGLYFNSQNSSQRAYGQKKIYILKSNTEVGFKEDVSDPEYTSLPTPLQIGNLIFENSCIYNDYDFTNIYAFYKLTDISSLVIGSVYENFYYTGDAEKDDKLKDELVYLTGTVLDEEGNVDTINSNYEIKFTKNEVDTNSFYAIDGNLGVVPCDRVNVFTANISEEFPNATISFTFDSITTPEAIIDVNLAGLTNGTDVAHAIREAIITNEYTGEEDENIYKDYIKNIDKVVYTSYDCMNQVNLRNLDRANGNVTFYYPGKFEEEDILKMYRLFFGTSRTNSSLYELYPPSMFTAENIRGVDEEGNIMDEPTYDENGNLTCEYFYYPVDGAPLQFTYRKLVRDGAIATSKPADYYITYNSDSHQYMLVKTENSQFPSSSFYMHFINDRSSLTSLECDEKTINEYMNDKKISGMDLYLAKPYFRGYDIKATVFYNANYSESTIKNAVESAVDELCNIKNSEIGGYMSQARIIKEVMACDGVENITINFFGYDYTNPSEITSTQLEAKFYEILHINDFEEGKHGILFDYEMQG